MMEKQILIAWVFCLVCANLDALDSSEDSENAWNDWKTKYKKVYCSSKEENERRKIWELNSLFVNTHNKQPNMTFTVDLNDFSDQLPQKRKQLGVQQKQRVYQSLPDAFAPPTHFDWRDKGDVTDVKNQGQIGAVEAFVATECFESFHAIHGGQLQDLSVEEVNDCCTYAGLPIVDDVFGCIHHHGGLCSADTYHSEGKCANNTCTAVAKGVSKTVFMKHGDEDGMLNAVLLVPLMVYIDASHTSFQLYTSGIYQDPNCSKTQVDHSLQIVGYGEDSQGTEYWICRNSWGKSWGMDGYINILRGQNTCGIATMAKYPA